MPRRKPGIFTKNPWLLDYLTQEHPDLKPQSIHVLGHVTDFRDGSMEKQITDGALWMRGIFTKEAIQNFNETFEDDSPPDWNCSRLLIKKYTPKIIIHRTKDEPTVYEPKLSIEIFELIDLEHGFYWKNNLQYVCDVHAIVDCAKNVADKFAFGSQENSSQNTENSDIGMTQLVNLLEEQSQGSQGSDAVNGQSPSPTANTMDEYPVKFDIRDFLVCDKNKQILNSLHNEDWATEAENKAPDPAHSSKGKASAKHPAKSSAKITKKSQPPTPNHRANMTCEIGIQVGESVIPPPSPAVAASRDPAVNSKSVRRHVRQSGMSQDAQRMDYSSSPDRLMIDFEYDSQAEETTDIRAQSTQIDPLSGKNGGPTDLNLSPVIAYTQEDSLTNVHLSEIQDNQPDKSKDAVDEEQRLSLLGSTTTPTRQLEKEARAVNNTPLKSARNEFEELERLEHLSNAIQADIAADSVSPEIVNTSDVRSVSEEEQPMAPHDIKTPGKEQVSSVLSSHNATNQGEIPQAMSVSVNTSAQLESSVAKQPENSLSDTIDRILADLELVDEVENQPEKQDSVPGNDQETDEMIRDDGLMFPPELSDPPQTGVIRIQDSDESENETHTRKTLDDSNNIPPPATELGKEAHNRSRTKSKTKVLNRQDSAESKNPLPASEHETKTHSRPGPKSKDKVPNRQDSEGSEKEIDTGKNPDDGNANPLSPTKKEPHTQPGTKSRDKVPNRQDSAGSEKEIDTGKTPDDGYINPLSPTEKVPNTQAGTKSKDKVPNRQDSAESEKDTDTGKTPDDGYINPLSPTEKVPNTQSGTKSKEKVVNRLDSAESEKEKEGEIPGDSIANSAPATELGKEADTRPTTKSKDKVLNRQDSAESQSGAETGKTADDNIKNPLSPIEKESHTRPRTKSKDKEPVKKDPKVLYRKVRHTSKAGKHKLFTDTMLEPGHENIDSNVTREESHVAATTMANEQHGGAIESEPMEQESHQPATSVATAPSRSKRQKVNEQQVKAIESEPMEQEPAMSDVTKPSRPKLQKVDEHENKSPKLSVLKSKSSTSVGSRKQRFNVKKPKRRAHKSGSDASSVSKRRSSSSLTSSSEKDRTKHSSDGTAIKDNRPAPHFTNLSISTPENSLTSYQPGQLPRTRTSDESNTNNSEGLHSMVDLSLIEDLLNEEAKKYGYSRDIVKNFPCSSDVLTRTYVYLGHN